MTVRIGNVSPNVNSLNIFEIMKIESEVKKRTKVKTLGLGTVFSGIGTPEYSLNRGGWEHENVFACEMDKYARETYILNYGKPKTFYTNILDMDATKYLGHIDILFGGSPCQAFSIAGKRGGFEDTRGTLFYEYARVLKESAAPCFVYENVKGMLNHDKPKVYQFELNIFNNENYYTWKSFQVNFKLKSKEYIELNKAALKTKAGVIFNNKYYKSGYPSLVNKTYNGIKKGIGKTLHIVENTFEDLGYHFKWTILNTKEHGIPQNRERIYIVGFRDEKNHKKFKFREKEELKLRLIDMLEDEVDEKYLLDGALVEEYKNHGTASRYKGSQAGKVCDTQLSDSFHTINSGSQGYSMGFVKYPNEIFFKQRGRYCKNASSIRMVGRRLNEEGKRSDYNYSIPTKQQIEFRKDLVANCITCVQKDSMVAIRKKANKEKITWFTPIQYADYLIASNNIELPIQKERVYKEILNGLIEVHDDEIRVKEAVKRGYSLAKIGDSINLSVPGSDTRRGRVGKEVAQTLDCEKSSQRGANCLQLTDFVVKEGNNLSSVLFGTGMNVSSVRMEAERSNQAVVTNEIKLNHTHSFEIKGAESTKRIYDANGLCPSITTCSITTCGGGHREPKVAIDRLSICDDTQGFDGIRNYKDFSPSIRASRSGLKWQINDYIFRKLTPRECFRLQGFDDDFKFNVSDTQAYKQAGNSMSANITDGIINDICEILGISHTHY